MKESNKQDSEWAVRNQLARLAKASNKDVFPTPFRPLIRLMRANDEMETSSKHRKFCNLTELYMLKIPRNFCRANDHNFIYIEVYLD